MADIDPPNLRFVNGNPAKILLFNEIWNGTVVLDFITCILISNSPDSNLNFDSENEAIGSETLVPSQQMILIFQCL